MNMLRLLLVVMFLAAAVVPQSTSGTVDNQERYQQGTVQRPLVGHVDNQERGPSFSSPTITMHENGDRVSPYPPYYRPDGGGRR